MRGKICQAEATESAETRVGKGTHFQATLSVDRPESAGGNGRHTWEGMMGRDQHRPGSPLLPPSFPLEQYCRFPSEGPLTFNYLTCDLPDLLWKMRLTVSGEKPGVPSSSLQGVCIVGLWDLETIQNAMTALEDSHSAVPGRSPRQQRVGWMERD